MTMAKQDPEAWRKRVDRKLNSLTKGYDELSLRIDAQTERIDKKLDTLITRTEPAIRIAHKASWVTTGVHWAGHAIHKVMRWLGEVGFGVLMLFTFLYIFSKSKSFVEFFTSFNWFGGK